MIARNPFGLVTLLLLFFAVSVAPAETALEVIHKKRFWPDGKGVLRITEAAIEFQAEDKDRSRRWAFEDIQFLDRVNPAEIVLLSYEDVPPHLGRDKRYHFVITAGELTETEFNKILKGMKKPAANRAFAMPEARDYEVRVKHLHRWGGCEGTLVFTGTEVLYEAEGGRHSRQWQLASDLESVWSADPYQLEVHVFEGGRRAFSKVRIYSFDLKQRLEEEFYRQLKLRLYNLRERNRSAAVEPQN